MTASNGSTVLESRLLLRVSWRRLLRFSSVLRSFWRSALRLSLRASELTSLRFSSRDSLRGSLRLLPLRPRRRSSF